MRILVSCANGSGTSLMMMRSVEKAMKELGVPITKIHHCAISEGKSSASQYDDLLQSIFYKCFSKQKNVESQ